MNRPWRDTILARQATVRDAVETLNRASLQICLIVDPKGRLIGTVTDGDIRRGLLAGCDFDTNITQIMNAAPCTARPETKHDALVDLMTSLGIRQVPLVDETRHIVGLSLIDDLLSEPSRFDNWVVLMAGGLGKRLRPLTENMPKPLLSVGDKPLLETILESFQRQGFHRFYISVNYLAESIKNHFGDGQKWGVEVRYLEEAAPLGTAGALSLIPETPALPLIVMNGDLITRVNFKDLLAYHEEHDAIGTMCVREYDMEVPFGVVDIENHEIRNIDEKPIHRFFVNAGIYVVDPEALTLVSDGMKFDMTRLFDVMRAQGGSTTAFPIHEYWLDVGRIDDFERAKIDFDNGALI